MVPRSKWEFCRSWTILQCSSITGWTEDPIFIPRIHITSKRREKLHKRVDRKRCAVWPCLGHKSLQKTHGRCSVGVVVPSLFEDQTTSWIRIVNRVEKYVRKGNADPRRRKSFGEPRCKGETNIETVTNMQLELYVDGIEKMDWHWSEKIRGSLLLPDVKIHVSFTST